MKLRATLANAAWLVSNSASWLRFCQALEEPGEVQRRWLRQSVGRHAGSAYGRVHVFEEIRNYERFADRVPIVSYRDLEPWIERICRGEQNLLTTDRVSRLVPTSGSTAARKLIPFTASLQKEFNAAIGPWMGDLCQAHPGMFGGPAYWSLTPAVRIETADTSAVPIGFGEDTEYLGGARRWLVEGVMAASSFLSQITEISSFRYVLLLSLLKERDLRFISIWHPSFLTLLLDQSVMRWDELLSDLRAGTCRATSRLPKTLQDRLKIAPAPRRADELSKADPLRPETIWSKLAVISCWADGHAAMAVKDIRNRFPTTAFQAKGLLATEGVITIPFNDGYPVAVTSHFFEFEDDHGVVRLVDQLEYGRVYEVILTTSGGLWRYRLGDRVEVVGFVGATPSLHFVGRAGCVSDLCGEKLSDEFVAQVLSGAISASQNSPRFMLMAAEEPKEGPHYTLYFEGDAAPDLEEKVEAALRQNPHYAYCRDLGQLSVLRVFHIHSSGYETYMRAETLRGARLGEIKPCALSRRTDWSKHFEGKYRAQAEGKRTLG